MTLKDDLAEGKIVVGSWIMSGSPVVAEVMSYTDMDFLVLDAEHGPIDLPQAHTILSGVMCPTLVRIENGGNYWTIKRYLDAGADGVIVPRVESAYQLKAIQNASFYPPKGRRGLGYVRSNFYGETAQNAARDNEYTIVVPQIESITGISNLPPILEEHPDAAMIGPWDLTADMGIPGQWEQEGYKETLKYFLKECNRVGVAPGIHIPEPDIPACQRVIEMGFRFIVYAMDLSILRSGCNSAYEVLRGEA